MDYSKMKKSQLIEEIEVLEERVAKLEHAEAERKQGEEALRESKQLLEKTFASLHDAVFIIDAATTEILDCNPAASEIFGYSRQEMLGRTTAFLHVDEATLKEFRWHLYSAVEEKGFLFLPEFRMKRKDGTVFPTEHSVMPLQDEHGQRIGWVSVVQDITERKRAEEALRESEKRFRELVENANDIIYTHDLQGNFTSANPAATRVYGYTNEEILQLNIADIVDPEHLPLARQKIRAKLEGTPQTEPYELLTYSKAGQPIWVEVNTRLLEREGQPAGVLGIARDITDRKRAEEELRASEERYRAVVEDQMELICRFSPDGTLTFVNEAYCRYFGKRAEELIGHSAMPLIPEEDREFVRQQFRSLSLDNPVITYEHRVVTPSGEIRWQQWSDRAIWDEGGHIIEFQSVGRDITDRKRTEEELRESYVKLRKALGATIEVLVSAVEMKDPYTAGHQRRVADLARAIATEMGLSKDQIEGIRMAGVVHDIGKISIPAEILSKPSRLNELEWGLIKTHPEISYNVLKRIEFPWPVAEIALQHHERLNGSGYPQGLTSEEIMIEARILAVADVVEAMSSHRPYRPAHDIDKALEEISQNRGILYDPEAVDVCLRLFIEEGFEFK